MVFTLTEHNSSSKLMLDKTEHFWKKRNPKRQEHYTLEDFFCFQQEQGKIIDWNESRNILVSEDFIIGLIEGLEEEVGSASSVVMYNIGREWGKRDADFFKNWFEKEFEYEKGINQHSLLYVLEAWWWPFTSQGWGNWDVDLSEQKNGFIFVNIFDSAVARTLARLYPSSGIAEQVRPSVEEGTRNFHHVGISTGGLKSLQLPKLLSDKR